MRFFEIASPKLGIKASKRYLRNAALYLRGGYSGLEKALRSFLEFKTANPQAQWGTRDRPFTGGPLKGIGHAHLVKGKVVLIYEVRNGDLILYDINEHDAFEGAAIGTLADYIASCKVEPLTMGGEQNIPETLSQEAVEELDELFWMMVAQDRDIVLQAIQGDFSTIMEFMRMTVSASDEAIMAAMGGPDGLRSKLENIIKMIG